MATSLLKFSLKTNLVKSVISEIVSNISRYYYVYCHPGNWTDETTPEAVSDSFEYENATRNEAILYKQIDANDICAVIPRINWVAGYTFDMYNEYSSDSPAFSGATALENAQFYCLTDDYNVYKCLFNNNDKPSSIRPTGTSVTPITLDDGYMWKYMYTIPLSVRNKFLTASTMPVVTALSNQFYSKGAITSFTIENPGKKYPITSYKVTGFKIIDGGSGYNNTPTILLSNPDQAGGVPATIGTVTLSGGRITAVSINTQGSGYSYPPTVTVSGGGATRQASLEPIVSRISSVYTTLTVSGDGVLEENPYVVDSVDVVTGGTGYATLDLLFIDPDLPNGVRAAAHGVIVNGVVTSIIVDNQGYGYSKPFNSQLQDPNNTIGNIVLVNATSIAGQSAAGFTFRVNTKKNDAELVPLINANGEIESIKITKPGIGYTYALVTVNTSLDKENTDGFEEASILLNFGIGDIESRQSTVELTTAIGAIHVIKVTDPGFGYTSPPIVSIVGDGSGCTAHAVLTDTGNIDKIVIDSIGADYTKATVTLTGAAAQVGSVSAIISPKGGHGRDAVGELYSKTVVLTGNLSKEKNKGFTSTNDYRQVCIVKNPKIFGKDTNLRSALASTCFIAVGSSGQAGFDLLNQDDILQWTDTTATPNRVYQFRVIEKNSSYSASESSLLLSYLDNKIPDSGSTFVRPAATGIQGAVFNTTNIILPDVNKFSGDMLTIDNRLRFSPSDQQIVVVTNSITF